MIHSRFSRCVTLLACLCASALHLTAAPEQVESTTTTARPTLSPGMTGAQVLAITGKPRSIQKIDKGGIKAEIWQYAFDRTVGVSQIASRTREVPSVNPITGEIKMIPEPDFTEERTVLVEITELLMIDDKLIETKRRREINKTH